MKAIYQPPFSYLAVISWIFGNVMFLYTYMIAVAKLKQWDITKYIFLIPIYWLLMSTAAMIALYQLIFKPHYWEKTIHGFHLIKQKQTATVVQPITQPIPQPVVTPAYVAVVNESTKQRVSFDAFSRLKISYITSFILRWAPLFAILNVDLALSRAFLSYEDAQTYILISIIGKSVFLLSQFGSNVLTSYTTVSKVSKAYLYRLIFFTFLFNWAGFIIFGLEGNLFITALFGQRFILAAPYMSYYLFGLLCFGIAYRLTTFNFYKKTYTYTLATLGAVLLEAPFIYFHHDTLKEVVLSFSYIGSINLILLLMFEMSIGLKRITENNVTSVLRLFEKPVHAADFTGSNMRILIFNWRDIKHRYSGGAEVYIHELSKRWVANGSTVTLFCGNDNTQPNYEKIDGIEIYRRGGTYTVYIFAFIFYLLKFRGKYDVIVDCENGIPFFTPLYAKEQVILLIHHVHQEIFHSFLIFPFNFLAELLEGKLMPLVYQNKNVVTVSASSQKDIIKLGFTKEKNIQIIPNGVASSLFVEYPKTDHPSFIYLGRLKEYKNIDVALKAFAKVVAIKKNATFSVVGSGESYYRLQKLVAELHIEKVVTFYGRVSEEEKAKLLAKSWAAIQPSQIEGWGITVIEANAAGTPVIASQVNGLIDSIVDGKTGLLVDQGNVRQFALAMRILTRNESLRVNLSQEALIWAKNFDWNKSAEMFYNLIGQNFGQGVFQPNYSDILYSAVDNNA